MDKQLALPALAFRKQESSMDKQLALPALAFFTIFRHEQQ
jgi:hypothetical protein